MVSLTKLLIYGLVGAFAVSALIDPARARGTAQAFGGIGSALGNLGTGTQSLLTGIGTGASKLLNPLWTLRDLIFSPQAGVQTQTDIQQATSTGSILTSQQNVKEQVAIQLDPTAPFTPITAGHIMQQGITPNYNIQAAEQGAAVAANTALEQSSYRPGFSFRIDPSVGPVPTTSASVFNQNVPLSAAAIQYYQKIGVDVSPANNETVAANNSSNATSPGASAASPNFSRGAAQRAGYSTGRPNKGNR